jgi:hypothetical protein
VTKLRPAPLHRYAPGQFSCIEAANGTELLFYGNLGRYDEFVDQLRARVTCQVFDPYPWVSRKTTPTERARPR